MAKIKKAKKAKEPKKPFKESVPKGEKMTRAERKLNKKAIKEALKRKKAFEKRLDRSIGICAVLLCLVSAVLDIVLRSKKSSN